MCLAAVTKFSRYNESSDSDEADTSDSESSSSDDTDSDTDSLPASPKDDSHPRDVADVVVAEVDVGSSSADSVDSAAANVSEHSPTQRVPDADVPVVSAEQTELPTEDDTRRRRSASPESDRSSLSSVGTLPSPIRSPLQLDTGRISSLSRGEFRKDAAAFRPRERTDARRSSDRKHQLSTSRPGLAHSNIRNERSQLQTSNSFRSHPARNSSSASDLRPLSHLVGEKSSLNRHSAARDKKSPVRLTSRERRPSSDGLSVSRSYSSVMRQQSPRRPQCNDGVNRRKYSPGAERPLRPRSRSLSAGKSPDKVSLQAGSLHQPRSQSQEKDLPRSSRSHSSSKSCQRSSRSRSRGRLLDSPRAQSQSRSRSPVQSSFHMQTRSGSVAHSTSNCYKDAVQRQPSRSSSTDRTLLTKHTRDVSSPPTSEDRKFSVKSSPYRSYSRSPDGTERQPRRTDTKPFPSQEFFERQCSNSRSSSHHTSPSPTLSDRRFPSPREKETLTERHLSGRSTAKPNESVSRRDPEVRNRLSPLTSRVRRRSLSSDRCLPQRRRSPDNRSSVRNSPVSQRHRIRDRGGGSPQRTDKAVPPNVRKKYSPSPPDAAETKTNSLYKSRSQDRRDLGRSMRNVPVSSKPKSSVKFEVHHSRRGEFRPPSQKTHRQNLAESPSHPRGVTGDRSEDAPVVERLKKLAEPDNTVQDKMAKSSIKSAGSLQAHLQEGQTESRKNESIPTGLVKISTHKALALKRPAASDASVLEARKRRFEEMQDRDSRSVCIRPSSDAETDNNAKRSRRFSPIQSNTSKQVGKDLKERVGGHETSDTARESIGEKSSGKMQLDASDISDLTSADSSMSLEDISEDETPRVQAQQLGEQSDLDLTRQPPGRALKVGKEGDKFRGRDKSNDSEDATTGVKTSTISSIVKPVKKDTELSEIRRPVEAASRRSLPAADVESNDDDSPTSDDGLVVKTTVRNVVNKG